MKKIKYLFWLILIITSVITAHELGHFCTARFFGVGVQRFSLFFGPAIYSINCGETDFSIGCIPLGGYCLLAGEQNRRELEAIKQSKPLQYRMLADSSRWLSGRSSFQQFIIAIAGIAVNLAAGIALLSYWACSHPSMENPDESIPVFLRKMAQSMMVRIYRGRLPVPDPMDFRIRSADSKREMILLNLGVNSLLIGLLNALPFYPFLDGGKIWAVASFLLFPKVVATFGIFTSNVVVLSVAIWGRINQR